LDCYPAVHKKAGYAAPFLVVPGCATVGMVRGGRCRAFEEDSGESIGKGWNPAQVFVTSIFAFVLVQSLLAVPSLPSRLGERDDMEKTAIYLKDYIHQGDLITASTARLPALRYYFNYYDVPSGYIRQSGKFQRAFIIVDRQKGETLDTVAPKMGFDIPVIDMDTAKVLVQFDYLTVYECYPVP
jgi:hypothetical protein